MPLLFVILGQKLGIPVTITTAPQHLYLKFRADNGLWFGVEATSGGGWAEDAWQQKQFPLMTPTAVANGIYMQPLSKRETAATIADSLVENYEGHQTDDADEARIKLSLLLVKHYPKDVVAMSHAYLGFIGLRRRQFLEKYPLEIDIPVALRSRFMQLENGWRYWSDKLMATGFKVPTAASEAEYRQRIATANASNHPPRNTIFLTQDK